MERLYQRRPWMEEGMYVVGTRPKTIGEGVVVEAYTLSYTRAYEHWRTHKTWGIFQYTNGTLRYIGRKMRNPRTGFIFYVPIPPVHLATA